MTDPIKQTFIKILDFKFDSYLWAAFGFLGITDITSLMYVLPEDITSPYTLLSDDDPPVVTSHIISRSDARKIIQFITWFKLQSPLSTAEFLALKKKDFNHWFQQTLKPPEAPTSTPLKALPTSSSHIRINLTDYPILKDDKGWRQYHRLLLSTASTHNTSNVLTKDYTPTPEKTTSYKEMTLFMYNVFCRTLFTGKGKMCVRTHAKTNNSCAVYLDLLSTYEDDLSTSLAAATMRQELTLLRLDEKDRKSTRLNSSHSTLSRMPSSA